MLSTGQGVLGYNMYAYCNNNPANYSDSTGTLPQNIHLNNMMLYESGGYVFHESDIERAENEVEKQAHNFNNTDEQVVLGADNWAFYKGKLVIKVPFMNKDAASFGLILLGSNVHMRNDVGMIVQHEYGHTVQFENMGVLVYAATVAIPSLIGYAVDASEKMPFGYLINRGNTGLISMAV